MITDYDLPQPEPEALLRSQALILHIKQLIAQHGRPLSFAEFMDLALYHPEWGYYTGKTFELGAGGDFTTAPEISPLFAQCMARQYSQVAAHLPHYILEIGAGTGRFAADLLKQLERTGSLPTHYYILEISPSLREKQRDHLAVACPALASRVTWLDKLPDEFSGVIIANEVLDALPTHCLRIQDDNIQERCVTWENGELHWQDRLPADPLLTEKCRQLREQYHLPNGYESEINLHQQNMVTALANCLKLGLILFSDYGYGQREYYHPQRNKGTLTCFYRHHHHQNPLIYPGLQDITAHVDFTSIIETAADQGCTLEGFTTQGSFLLSCGLLELAAAEEKHLSPVQEVSLHHAIKVLTLPTEMGDIVKVMALGKNLDQIKEISLIGFTMLDRSRDL